jgi:hypothetical protein
MPRAHGLHFPEQDCLGSYRETELFTSGGEPIHVRLPETGLSVQYRHGFEQAISVLQPTVSGQNPIRNFTIHQAFKHVFSPLLHRH